MSPRRGDVASSVSPTAHESAPQGHAGHTQHTRNISVNIEAITDLIKRFNEEQTRNEAALAQNHRSSAPADGPTMRASPDLGSDEPSGTLQPSAHILPPAAPASPVPVPIQQTRSGRISRPPPPTPALSARASPLRFQLSPRAGFVHDGGSTGSGGASLSIDSIASSHLAILRNLMGSSNARYAAGMNGVEAGGEGGSADATTSEIAVVQPLQNQAQAQARYSVAPVPAAPAPPAPLPPANRRSRKRRHSDDEDEDDSPEATTPEAGSTRLAVSPKTEARRAKNKYSARQSRMKKEAMVQDMKDRIASLEDELEMSRAKYQVLSQQWVPKGLERLRQLMGKSTGTSNCKIGMYLSVRQCRLPDTPQRQFRPVRSTHNRPINTIRHLQRRVMATPKLSQIFDTARLIPQINIRIASPRLLLQVRSAK